MEDVSQQADDQCANPMISRNHPTAARILRRWREYTGGKAVRDIDRKTVVACSGGADSVALAATLAFVNPKPVIAHVVHDIRADGSAQADRDAVQQLAKALDCPFVQREVAIKSHAGNLEHNARNARYAALLEVAQEVDAKIIVTGHHADDQLETMLMHLMRGTGVRGMGGISATRMIGNMAIVRPMLEVARQEIEHLCVQAGLGWQHDSTNDDDTYLRNKIRHSVVPMLREIEPEIASRASKLARSCQDASNCIAHSVRTGVVVKAVRDGNQWSWAREELRNEPKAVLAELVFVYVSDVLDGEGADSINRQTVEGLSRAIKSDSTEPLVHRVGPIVVHVQARTVVISVARSSASQEAGKERS